MAMSIPNPKRASAITFLSGEVNGNDITLSPSSVPLTLSGKSDGFDGLSDWRNMGQALDTPVDPAGLDASNSLFANSQLPFDRIVSESSLLDSVAQKSITPTPTLPIGAERTPSTAPVESPFGMWGQGLGIPNPVKAKASMLDEGWDLNYIPGGGMAERSNFPNSFSGHMHRPLSTPAYGTGGGNMFSDLLGNGGGGNPDSHLTGGGSGKLTSHFSSSALEALNGIGTMADQHEWSRPVRQMTPLYDTVDAHPFVSGGGGPSFATLEAAGVYKVPNNSANFLDRAPSAPLFDNGPYTYHGTLHGATPLGSNNNLAGLLPRSNTPSHQHTHHQHPHQHQQQHQHMSHHYTQPSPAPNKLSLHGVDERAIENVVANNCQQILLDAMYHSLKAVELANTLRARVGTEILAMVREKWGGLLSLLERHSDRFLVERIPKNDRVSLVNFVASSAGPSELTPAEATTSNNSSNTANANAAANAAAALTDSERNTSTESEGAKSLVSDDTAVTGPTDDSVGDAEEDLANASRCLHVGNVPVGYTEVQLMREFEKFGTLEGLKLISQKNNIRRFAFVTYKTVSQAVTAKLCLSKVHPWKSAISFAHKDISTLHHGHAHAAHGHHAMHPHSQHPASALTHGGGGGSGYHVGHTNFAHFNNYAGKHGSAHKPHALQPHRGIGGHHHALVQRTASPSAYSVMFHDHATLLSVMGASSPHLEMMNDEEGGNMGAMHGHGQGHGQGGHPHRHSLAHSIKDPAVLQRLCDDTYVPTQPWPVDAHHDMILIGAIQQQLAEFNGTTTISKLRGYLKHRIGVSDNIKSVPLKALLLAYPHYFHVDGNIVTMLKPQAATGL